MTAEDVNTVAPDVNSNTLNIFVMDMLASFSGGMFTDTVSTPVFDCDVADANNMTEPKATRIPIPSTNRPKFVPEKSTEIPAEGIVVRLVDVMVGAEYDRDDEDKDEVCPPIFTKKRRLVPIPGGVSHVISRDNQVTWHALAAY